MAFDILIDDSGNFNKRIIHLSIEDYDFIMEKLKNSEGSLLLKRVLADYYGESEIYINELGSFRLELDNFRKAFESSLTEHVILFLDDFSELVDYAIENRKSIKFQGD